MKAIVVAAVFLYLVDIGATLIVKRDYADRYKDPRSSKSLIPVVVLVLPDKEEPQKYLSKKLRNIVNNNIIPNLKIFDGDKNIAAEYFDLDVERKEKDDEYDIVRKIEREEQEANSPLLRGRTCVDFHADCMRNCLADQYCQQKRSRPLCQSVCGNECKTMIPCPQLWKK